MMLEGRQRVNYAETAIETYIRAVKEFLSTSTVPLIA
jgi:hypothetical protein